MGGGGVEGEKGARDCGALAGRGALKHHFTITVQSYLPESRRNGGVME